MEPVSLFIIFIVGLVSAIFGTLVGGASLITIPLVIFLGLPPNAAIASNRFGIVGASITGWYKFHEKKLINYKLGIVLATTAIFGAIIGSTLVLQLNEDILRRVIAVITILILIFIITRSKIGVEKIKHKIKTNEYIIGAVLAFFFGIYGGFYGAGVGTLFSYLLLLLFGQTFLEAAATRKIAVLFLSLTAVVVFAINDVIVYPVAITLFVGMAIGSYIGAHYSERIGNKWIRIIFILIVLIMSIKLLV